MKILGFLGATGFKSNCVTFCYLAFAFVTTFILIIFTIGTFTGIDVSGTFMLDFYKIFVGLDGVAIVAIFGASYVDGKFNQPPQQN